MNSDLQTRPAAASSEGRVTPDAIVSEAIRLLNEAGIDGVSLRPLAARLGIKAPSLYWHFRDKSALLAAIIERIFEEGLRSVPSHRHWQDWMRGFGRAMWDTQATTRDFTRLVTTTLLPDAQLERTLRRISDSMAGIDLEAAEAMRIQSSVQVLVLGWSAFANAPYASKLAEVLDFEALAMENLELLIAGETLKLAAGPNRG